MQRQYQITRCGFVVKILSGSHFLRGGCCYNVRYSSPCRSGTPIVYSFPVNFLSPAVENTGTIAPGNKRQNEGNYCYTEFVGVHDLPGNFPGVFSGITHNPIKNKEGNEEPAPLSVAARL